MSSIIINNTEMRVIEYQDQRVATLAQIDEVHSRPEGTARRNFNANKHHLRAGEDFSKVSADEFRTRFPGVISGRATEDVTLIFETGYLMLVKSFTDDLAWQVQRQLVNGYFRGNRHQAVPALPNFADPVAAARAWADAKEGEQKAAAELALAAPKVTYADAMLNSDGTVLVRDAAKIIGVPVRKLQKALREKEVILLDNAPAAKYVTQGYFVESLGYYETNTRGRQISRTARVTALGLEFLRRFAERHADMLAATPRKRTQRLGANHA